MEKRPAHRPSSYTKEKAAEICRLIADGLTSRDIAAMPGMPPWSTVCRWLEANDEFRKQYARARELSAEALESEALERVRNASGEDAAAARVLLDAVKWAAAKRNPKVYGEKIDLNVTTDVTGSIERMRARRNVIDGE